MQTVAQDKIQRLRDVVRRDVEMIQGDEFRSSGFKWPLRINIRMNVVIRQRDRSTVDLIKSSQCVCACVCACLHVCVHMCVHD